MKLASSKKVHRFAREKVRETLEERYALATFSRELILEMGGLGLLGLTVAEEYGGSGGTPREYAALLRDFTRLGCDLGLSLSWITHLALCVKSVEQFGTREQKERYLPGLCSGEIIGAMAVSEPGSGAHPGAMDTSAVRRGNAYALSGNKVYITDGSVADLLVVIASTGTRKDGKKELTAFLVEASREGFEAEQMDLTFLKTAPHAEIRFKDLELDSTDVIGGIGEGHSLVSKHAFARERSSVMSALCGSFMAGAREVSDRYMQKNEGFDIDGKEASSWIHHISALEVYRRLTEELVEAAFVDRETYRDLIDLTIYLGMSYGKWGLWLGDFVVENGLKPTFPLNIILNDVKLSLIGEGILMKEGRRRYIG